MPLFVKTVSFRSQFVFSPARDDPEVNAVLRSIQEQGGVVRDVAVASAGNFGAFVATYVITYDAERPLDVLEASGSRLMPTALVLAGLGALVLLGVVALLAQS